MIVRRKQRLKVVPLSIWAASGQLQNKSSL